MSRKTTGALSVLVVALLVAGCGTSPSNPAVSPATSTIAQQSFTVRSMPGRSASPEPPVPQSAYPLSEWQLRSLFDADGSTATPPQPCGPEIPMETVRVLNVLGEERPREVVAASLPSAQFSTDDYWLMRAKHPGYDKNREEARFLSALLGCNVLVVGDFGTMIYKRIGTGMGRDRVFKVAWGSTEP